MEHITHVFMEHITHLIFWPSISMLTAPIAEYIICLLTLPLKSLFPNNCNINNSIRMHEQQIYCCTNLHQWVVFLEHHGVGHESEGILRSCLRRELYCDVDVRFDHHRHYHSHHGRSQH